jgi:hypothetical protein
MFVSTKPPDFQKADFSSITARKAALTPFCTPGFQSAKSTSTSRPRPKHDQVVYVLSDSTSSSRSALKRESSDLSITAEISPPVSKRQRKAPVEEKENALSVSSRTNYNALPTQTTLRPSKYADLSSVSSYTAISFNIINLQ